MVRVETSNSCNLIIVIHCAGQSRVCVKPSTAQLGLFPPREVFCRSTFHHKDGVFSWKFFSSRTGVFYCHLQTGLQTSLAVILFPQNEFVHMSSSIPTLCTYVVGLLVLEGEGA